MRCSSHSKEPINNCSTYRMQALLFHPDKNPNCIDESTLKFKKLTRMCPSGQTILKM